MGGLSKLVAVTVLLEREERRVDVGLIRSDIASLCHSLNKHNPAFLLERERARASDDLGITFVGTQYWEERVDPRKRTACATRHTTTHTKHALCAPHTTSPHLSICMMFPCVGRPRYR